MLLAGVIILVACWALLFGKIRLPVEKVSAALIIAGGAGNLCDRILRGYVVDYLDINEWFVFRCQFCGLLRRGGCNSSGHFGLLVRIPKFAQTQK
jgi:hypothetical protein